MVHPTRQEGDAVPPPCELKENRAKRSDLEEEKRVKDNSMLVFNRRVLTESS